MPISTTLIFVYRHFLLALAQFKADGASLGKFDRIVDRVDRDLTEARRSVYGSPDRLWAWRHRTRDP